jgi:hypothetical protein
MRLLMDEMYDKKDLITLRSVDIILQKSE